MYIYIVLENKKLGGVATRNLCDHVELLRYLIFHNLILILLSLIFLVLLIDDTEHMTLMKKKLRLVRDKEETKQKF